MNLYVSISTTLVCIHHDVFMMPMCTIISHVSRRFPDLLKGNKLISEVLEKIRCIQGQMLDFVE